MPRDRDTLNSLIYVLVCERAKFLLKAEFQRTGYRPASLGYEAALQSALVQQDFATFKLVLESGIPFNRSTIDQACTLESAIKRRNLIALKYMFEHGTHAISLRDHPHLLVRAAFTGDLDMVGLLLDQESGVRTGADRWDRRLAIDTAQHDNILRYLVSYGLNMNETLDSHKGHAIRAACARGLADVVELLIEHGADVNFVPDQSSSVASPYVSSACYRAIDEGDTPLWCAYSEDHIDIVSILIAAGARIDLSDKAKQRVFTQACIQGDEAVVLALIKAKVKLNGHYLGRPLFFAVSRQGHTQVLEILFDHGADPDVAEGRHCHDAVLEATRQGHSEVVQVLLSRSKTIDRPCYFRWTVMEEAVIQRDSNVVRMLLDTDGLRAQDRCVYLESLRLAISRGYDEIAQTLRDRGVSLPEETLPKIQCAAHDAWVNALPAAFCVRESAYGFSDVSEFLEEEMI